MSTEDPSPPELDPAEAELMAALRDLGDGPCLGCEFRRFCAEEPAACRDYVSWVETGLVCNNGRHPTRDLFDFIEGLPPLGGLPRGARLRSSVLQALCIEAEHGRPAPGVYPDPFGRRRRGTAEPVSAADWRNALRWYRDHGVKLSSGALQRMLLRGGGQQPTDGAVRHATYGKP